MSSVCSHFPNKYDLFMIYLRNTRARSRMCVFGGCLVAVRSSMHTGTESDRERASEKGSGGTIIFRVCSGRKDDVGCWYRDASFWYGCCGGNAADATTTRSP